MNVPKLRFKEFTDEWNYTCLSEISAEITYGMNSASTEFDGLNKYIRITDIDDETGNFKPSNLVSPLNKPEDKFLVKKDDILFARTGASTGKTYLYNIKDGKLYFAGFLIKAHIVNHNSNFIFQQTKLEKYKKWVKLTSMRSGQPGINSEEYGKCVFSITSLSEENKIAQFLSLLDKKIELQTKKIEALKLFKSYTKSEIFKNGNHVCKLGAILNKWNKKNKDGAINYVESISNKAGFVPQSEQFEDRNVASKNLRNYYVIKKGVFGYNPSRLNVGSLALKENDFISVVSPLYECFTTTQNNTYLFEWFNSNNFKKETFSKFEGGVRNTLNFNNLCDIPINLPDIETQNQYAKYFNKINFKISLEEQKLSELVKLKKGLLQEMFI